MTATIINEDYYYYYYYCLFVFFSFYFTFMGYVPELKMID